MNCLEYLLDLWNRGHRFVILYNGNHCIGVNEKKIFELGDTFKKDLLAGYSLRGGDSYVPIESSFDLDALVRCFNLPPHYFIVAQEYYESIKSEV
jgi:hypothetical protein